MYLMLYVFSNVLKILVDMYYENRQEKKDPMLLWNRVINDTQIAKLIIQTSESCID